MLSINSKIGRFVKLILFAAELALPSWLRLQRAWFLIPVIEVMIFIPIWPPIRWHTFNILKCILVSSYMLIASVWKLIAFGNNGSTRSNTHTRLNWSSFKEAPYRNLDMGQQAQNWCSLELRLFTVEMLQYQHLNPVYNGFSIWVYIAEVTLYLIITYFTVVTVTDWLFYQLHFYSVWVAIFFSYFAILSLFTKVLRNIHCTTLKVETVQFIAI